VNPLGYYELYINGRKVDDHVLSPAVSDYSKRNLYVTHDVAEYLVPGNNVVALWLGRGWYVKGHPGVIHDGPLVRAQLEISMGGGSTARIVTDETWKVRESPITPLGRGTAFGAL
jgi:alpha-L-rhamnosidase